MTLTYKSVRDILKTYICTYKSRLSKVRARTGQTDRHTHTHAHTHTHTHTHTDATERITTAAFAVVITIGDCQSQIYVNGE